MPTSPPRARQLLGLIEPWAHDRPDDVAITYGERSWTWGEWDERIHRLIGALADAGIARGDRVGVLDKNHPACLEIVLAAGALGAAVGIVNWRLAQDELAVVLADCAPSLLFVGAEFADGVDAELCPSARRTIVIDGDYDAFVADAGVRSGGDADPEDIALLMYSSGTTGQPKGVMLSHRALLAHTGNATALFPFAAGDVNLVAMPLFHVGGTSYALLGLAGGVATIMTREPTPSALLGALDAGATHTFFVPPVIAGFLAAGPPATAALARLRYLGYGAAPMPLPLLEQALAVWPDVRFVQVYGQTELSGVVTALGPDGHHDPAHPEWLLSVGTPVPGCELRVIDLVTGSEVPPGEQGELWVRSEQRMTGYLNQPDDTAATITADGWLRTGDIGHIDATGHVYVEDRLKDLIITGGENVYGPEVERTLMRHPAVTDAAVIGVPDDHWGESVLAIIAVCEPVQAADVIAFCHAHLAGYKCPRQVTFVDALPRNPSGKIIKRQLREPYWAGRTRRI